MYDIQHCFICRPSDSTVSKDTGIEPRTIATTALAVRRSNSSARSHPHSVRKLTWAVSSPWAVSVLWEAWAPAAFAVSAIFPHPRQMSPRKDPAQRK